MVNRYRIVALPGEGIGVEVTEAALAVLEQVSQQHGFSVQVERALLGKPAQEVYGNPFPPSTATQCEGSDGILLGAVSQGGLLELRKHFDLFANLRPIRPLPCLFPHSPLQPEKLQGVDILFVRELVSGIYFGASGRGEDAAGAYGYHTMQYHDWEIDRIAEVALEKARQRRQHLTIAHKENALPHLPWRQRVMQVAKQYPDVQITPMLVDNLAMQLIVSPQSFDVILAGNLFGDILSDIGGAILGSIGLLGSASFNQQGFGLYEPIHGTAPDIAGKGIANPLGAVNSMVLMLEQWGETAAAARIMTAEHQLFSKGYRTADLMPKGGNNSVYIQVNTKDCISILLDEIDQIKL